MSQGPSDPEPVGERLPTLEELDDLIHRPIRELTPIQFLWLLEQEIPLPTGDKMPKLLTVIPDITRWPRRGD